MLLAKILVANCLQSSADTPTSVQIITNLRDQENVVLRVLRVELDFDPTAMYTWPSAVDCLFSANLSNEPGVYGGVSNKAVICRTSIVQMGTAAATTDRLFLNAPRVWEPVQGQNVYLYNERCYVNLLSVATGIVNVVGVRVTVDEVNIGSFAKTALKTV